MSFKTLLSSSAVAAAMLMLAAPAGALVINLTDTGGVVAGTAAYDGFRAAANFWQSVLSSNVTVNLKVGFTATGFGNPNIIGQTSSTSLGGAPIGSVYGKLASSGTSRLDAIAVAHLSPLSAGGVGVITQKPHGDGTGVLQNPRTGTGLELASNREFDADGSPNNTVSRVNTSVLKALGYDLTGAYDGYDGAITFNSAFNFDFNPTNGISAGQLDFVGVAIHEIGHALGFNSGVDLYDSFGNAPVNFDGEALATTLDLFRYSDDVGNLAPGAGQALDWSVGNSATAGNDLNGRPFFSFDGSTKGLSAYGGDSGYFSTGQLNGDGSQASHWMDTAYSTLPGNSGSTQCLASISPPRGILDPTFAGCEPGVVTSLDLAAFDAMGWNVRYDVLSNIGKTFNSADAVHGLGAVPEPATWALMIGGFGLVGGALRRQRRSGFASA